MGVIIFASLGRSHLPIATRGVLRLPLPRSPGEVSHTPNTSGSGGHASAGGQGVGLGQWKVSPYD